MKRLRNINPLGFVDLPLVRREGGDGEDRERAGVGCLVPGEVFEVSDEHAGEAPRWRPATDDDAEAIRRGHVETRATEADAVEVYDLGSGLLAQVGNYELVETPKKKG